MSRAARSVRWFGVYLGVLGAGLALAPNLLLRVFAMAQTQEVWIRVLGVVLFNVGVYYWYAAVAEAQGFFRASVVTRSLVLVAFVAFAALGIAPPMLLLFGVVDFVGGLWTAAALRGDRRG